MIATKNKPEIETDNKASAFRRIYRRMVSVRFSMFILSLIAAGSIVGTLIEQGASEEEYLGYYTENTYRIIKFFGLNDIYHSFWFYALVALFAVSLISCTIERLARFIRERHQNALPDADRLREMEFNTPVAQGKSHETLEKIRKSHRLVNENEDGAIFEKGIVSRYGVFIIHGSILTILAGGLIGHVWGFRGSVILRIGETRDRAIARDGSEKDMPLGFSIKCKDFRTSFYPNGTPREYVSAVEILEDDKVKREQEIRVNDPLSYKGIRLYQAGYGKTASFEFNVGGEKIEIGEQEVVRKGNVVFKVARFEEEVDNFGPGVQVVYLNGDEPKTTWFLLNVDKMKLQSINNVSIELENIRQEPYTVLEVARDPGVYVVWVGFALLLFGLFVNFFTYYRRIYVAKTESGILVAGHAAKNREAFKKGFEKFKRGTDVGTP